MTTKKKLSADEFAAKIDWDEGNWEVGLCELESSGFGPDDLEDSTLARLWRTYNMDTRRARTHVIRRRIMKRLIELGVDCDE